MKQIFCVLILAAACAAPAQAALEPEIVCVMDEGCNSPAVAELR